VVSVQQRLEFQNKWLLDILPQHIVELLIKSRYPIEELKTASSIHLGYLKNFNPSPVKKHWKPGYNHRGNDKDVKTVLIKKSSIIHKITRFGASLEKCNNSGE